MELQASGKEPRRAAWGPGHVLGLLSGKPTPVLGPSPCPLSLGESASPPAPQHPPALLT